MQENQLERAYRHCIDLAEKHYENFPTASLLIRPELRPAVAAIYAFARTADDFADEGDLKPETRLKQLDAWETLLDRCVKGSIDHPLFLALGDAIRKHSLPVDALRDLLTAFRMDITLCGYASEKELLFYCKHSANPVGRLILALHGISDPRALTASDAICTALQLTNFWQDLGIDSSKGRCYLTATWLAQAGLSNDLLLNDAPPPAPEQVKQALKPAILFTEKLFLRGLSLLPLLPFRLRLQIILSRRGGRSILRAVDRSDNPMHIRPTLTTLFWLRTLPGALFECMLHARSKGQTG